MYTQLKFKTERFQTKKIEMRFDPATCPGDDVAMWLGEHLAASGYEVLGTRHGGLDSWVVEVVDGGRKYLIGVGISNEGQEVIKNAALNSNLTIWYVVIEKKRTLFERLFLLNRLTSRDRLSETIYRLVNRQFDFMSVSRTNRYLAP